MKLVATPLPGVWIIDPDDHRDERGTFMTHFEEGWFREHGLYCGFTRTCTATNPRAGTLRGMHWQEAPDGEVKLVRCIRGAIYDVVLDLRPESATFRRWHAIEMTPDGGGALYVPAGCAHGYQTLADDSWVSYQIGAVHRPESARGVRWNDPAFAIRWPHCADRLMSRRDASYADYGHHK